MAEESTAGRICPLRQFNPLYSTPTDACDVWITSLDEVYQVNEKARVTFHVRNYKEEPITVYWWYQWFHSGGESLPSLGVGPGEEKEYYLEVDFPPYLAEFTEMQAFFHLRYKIDPDASYQTAKKGFLVKGIQTRSTLKLNTPSPIEPGGSLSYTIHSAYLYG